MYELGYADWITISFRISERWGVGGGGTNSLLGWGGFGGQTFHLECRFDFLGLIF